MFIKELTHIKQQPTCVQSLRTPLSNNIFDFYKQFGCYGDPNIIIIVVVEYCATCVNPFVDYCV